MHRSQSELSACVGRGSNRASTGSNTLALVRCPVRSLLRPLVHSSSPPPSSSVDSPVPPGRPQGTERLSVGLDCHHAGQAVAAATQQLAPTDLIPSCNDSWALRLVAFAALVPEPTKEGGPCNIPSPGQYPPRPVTLRSEIPQHLVGESPPPAAIH